MEKPSREAIVVGLCAHGIGLVHALARRGVRVHALEAKRGLPGLSTDLATIHLVEDVNGPGLVPSIVNVAESASGSGLPVLLLTNDRMVFSVAEQIRYLSGKVKVSWAASVDLVSTLLLKDNLPHICARAGLNYPRSAVISSVLPQSLIDAVEELRFPVLAKPVRPMASFKAVVLADATELRRHVELYGHELPILVQEWVPGDVSSLKFSAIYFNQGRPLAHFEGRKLDTLPRGTGTTTAAEAICDPALHDAALRFFAGLNLSGPASLEVKEDASGALWVIEPTAFRTDYWAGCCIDNGVNLPHIEYCHQVGLPVPETKRTTARVWIDLERNPASLLRVVRQRPGLLVRPWRLRFTYASLRDPRLVLSLALHWLARLRVSLVRRLARRAPSARA